MTKLRSQLAEALQANRDLRNQIHGVEFPLQKRIRDLEVERDNAQAQAAASTQEIRNLHRGMKYARGLIRWLLSSGKAERDGNL
jgi:hypothetical protein